MNNFLIGESSELRENIASDHDQQRNAITFVGYLLGEAANSNTFKDPAMLQRLSEISSLPEEDKHCFIYYR